MAKNTDLSAFTQNFERREEPCIAIFGCEGTGKTNLCATAGEWSQENGTVPGWLVCDRKTRKTVKEACDRLGLPYPYMNKEDFLDQSSALKLASNEDVKVVIDAYQRVVKKFIEAAVQLGASANVNPIVVDSGTQLWDWIAYSHFGRKQDVGKSRVWGYPKQDWTDIFDALQHKTVLITLRAKDEYRGDTRTGKFTWDGPPHLGYNTTSVIRLVQDKDKAIENYIDRFQLDVVESQDNKGLEGVDNVLSGESITFANLLNMLRPE